MDNLSSHEGSPVRELIEVAGAALLFLPPYSPDFDPIEMTFSTKKAWLRKTVARTVGDLWDAIGRIVQLFRPQDCANDFGAGSDVSD